MVDRLLGAPDKFAPNPVYRSKPPMWLYSLPRVEAAERAPGFSTFTREAAARTAAAAKAVATKREGVLGWAANVEIKVKHVDDVVRKAVAHYNRRGHERQWEGRRGSEDWEPARMDSSPSFLARITVNFVRHQMTHYEDFLVAKYGSVGVGEAKDLVRQRVLQAIAAEYPELADECQRQWVQRPRW